MIFLISYYLYLLQVSSSHESTTGDQLTSDSDDFNNGNGKKKRVAFKSPEPTKTKAKKPDHVNTLELEMRYVDLNMKLADVEKQRIEDKRDLEKQRIEDKRDLEAKRIEDKRETEKHEMQLGNTLSSVMDNVTNRLVVHDQEIGDLKNGQAMQGQHIAENREGVAQNREVIGKHGQKIAKLEEGHTELENLYAKGIKSAIEEAKQQAIQSAKKYSKQYSQQLSEGQPLSPNPTNGAIGKCHITL